MATDALDPGPNGDYPYFPRDTEGRPMWSDSPRGNPEGGTVIPRGIQYMRDPGDPRRLTALDLIPRLPDGAVIDPPDIPPDIPHAA